MSQFVKLSEGTIIAFHTLSLLAYSGDKLLSNREIAKGLECSYDHLSKILQRLTKAGLVSSVRGPTGGFKLAKQAKEVNLLQVVEAMEGPMDKFACPLANPTCPSPIKRCFVGPGVTDAEIALRKKFKETTLETIAKSFKEDK